MDGKSASNAFRLLIERFRMTIHEFKLSYMQINPNANMYMLDADAERKSDV